MFIIALLLGFVAAAHGADWTDAQWDSLYVQNEGNISPHFETYFGAGDTVYFISALDTNHDEIDDRWLFGQTHLPTGYCREIPLPDAVQQDFQSVMVRSVSHEYPALVTRFSLWTWSGLGWDSLYLLDSLAQPYEILYSCDFDDRGILHYLSGGGSGTHELEYHRIGIEPARDTVFTCHFEDGFAPPWNNRVWSPAADFVVIATGAHEPGGWQLFNSVFYYSNEDEPFAGDSTGVVNGISERVIISPWGAWCYGFISMQLNRREVWIRSGIGNFLGDWSNIGYSQAYRFRFGVISDIESTFELAIIQQTDSSLIHLLRQNFWGGWDEYGQITCPFDVLALGYAIDEAGYGHILAVPADNPWVLLHYGYTEPNAVESPPLLPQNIRLSINPNPFNNQTRISYQLEHNAPVEVTLHNILGERMATLVNSYQTAGRHETVLDGSTIASGTYFVRLSVGKAETTVKVQLLK